MDLRASKPIRACRQSEQTFLGFASNSLKNDKMWTRYGEWCGEKELRRWLRRDTWMEKSIIPSLRNIKEVVISCIKCENRNGMWAKSKQTFHLRDKLSRLLVISFGAGALGAYHNDRGVRRKKPCKGQLGYIISEEDFRRRRETFALKINRAQKLTEISWARMMPTIYRSCVWILASPNSM